MFRECYFEYAGVSSQPYNLMLCYVNNTTTNFDSGGNFDLQSATLPYSNETILYHKEYSSQPLEFEVEFMNLCDNIPLEQMTEIKDWLFGQDGWKTFKCLDERQDYHLKCIFEPEEDIVDSSGYRGIRCKLRNASPFWYGEEVIIVKNSFHEVTPSHSNGWEYYHDDDGIRAWGTCIIDTGNTCANVDIYPAILFHVDKTNSEYASSATKIVFATCAAPTKDQILDSTTVGDRNYWDYPNTSSVGFNIEYLDPTEADVISVNTKHALINSQQFPDQKVEWRVDHSALSPMFRLKRGVNMCRLCNTPTITDITIKYTPVYRMGAF